MSKETNTAPTRRAVTAVLCVFVMPAAGVRASDCGVAGGPDVGFADIVSIASYAPENGVAAFSAGVTLCNFGNLPADCQASTPLHPVWVTNLYRLKDVGGAARFEQIGMSWAYHEFLPLQMNACCQTCQPGESSQLGVQCSTSTSSGSAGTRTLLGPRAEVNPATGEFPYPHADPPWSGTIARRLQAAISDLDPLADGGGSYFIEVQCVALDDADDGNSGNNATHRAVRVVPAGESWNLLPTGAAAVGEAAMEGWRVADPQVYLSSLDVAGDGRFRLAARATALGGGVWRYEYALRNATSERAAQAFFVAIFPGTQVATVGFHDVHYHSGDGVGGVDFSAEDWEATVTAGGVSWSTQSYSDDPGANALRWGTLYNFRFDADRPPVLGEAAVTLFKPGTPASAAIATIVPGTCIGDVDASGAVGLADLSTLLSAYGLAGGFSPSDLDGDGDVDLADLSELLSVYGTSCP
ncbi:MAG: hypothetical protein HRF50_15630 [Phycisphaerae bacterium]|jgi:hypothetical protein